MTFWIVLIVLGFLIWQTGYARSLTVYQQHPLSASDFVTGLKQLVGGA